MIPDNNHTDNQKAILETIRFVQHELREAEGGHDWFHIQRVWVNAKKIAVSEPVDMFVVELGALLHDIADAKFHQGNEDIGPEKATKFLSSMHIDTNVIRHVEMIIRHISFKGGHVEKTFHSAELDVVQDADRLDAIGAIGIARAFHFGGFKNREIYNPAKPPLMQMDKDSYRKNDGPTINHFYEKLLLLKDRMNTQTGKQLAAQRHLFMETYLDQFYSEWNGDEIPDK